MLQDGAGVHPWVSLVVNKTVARVEAARLIMHEQVFREGEQRVVEEEAVHRGLNVAQEAMGVITDVVDV